MIIHTVSAVENCENNSNQNLDSIINMILELVNIERVKYNIAPLTIDPDSNSVAIIRSVEIRDLFEHLRPDGSSISTLSSKIQ